MRDEPRRLPHHPFAFILHLFRDQWERDMRYHIWTVGCQMNVADSQKLGAGLDRLGYEPVDDAEQADVVVLNTCAVRQGAEDRAISKLGTLRRLKQQRPELKVAMMGCMVGMRTTELE